ncbi:flavodoxin reductase [Candidatus Pacearchaeota archaeon]|nr:flavodoxin reductase [Candidatus Pacearchaeota archaeon]
MDLQKVKILKIERLTHDVKRFVLKKPSDYAFVPGQAIQLTIDKDGWRDGKRSFTITSAPDSDFLELIIKEYPEKHGVTEMLHKISEGDYLLISKPFGKFDYDKSKRKVFIAAGSAITKFLSLLRVLKSSNDINKLNNIILIYSNKTSGDVILEEELKEIFSGAAKNLVLVLTRESKESYINGRVSEELLRKYVDKESKVSVCGPPEFIKSMMDFARKIQS